MESKFLLNTCLEAGLPKFGWEMPFGPISCRPEQGLQNNQDVVITSFQLITYHTAQGRQSREGNSKRGAIGGSNQAVTCSESLKKWFIFVCYSQRKRASRVLNVHCEDASFHTTHQFKKILSFRHQIHLNDFISLTIKKKRNNGNIKDTLIRKVTESAKL